MHSTTIDTPPGPFTIVADDDAVVASGWTFTVDDLLPLVAPRLRPLTATPLPDLGEFSAAVRRYLGGDVSALDVVPVRQGSGPFLEHAWEVLRTVPPGAPVSYAEFAAKCGAPAAIRAAGNACARNAVALFVPCHRVLRTGGGLGGFRYGLPVKRWLLDHESAGGPARLG